MFSDGATTVQRITPTPNYLPFINGGRFEALLLTTRDPVVEARKAAEAAAAVEKAKLLPTPSQMMAKSRWSMTSASLGVTIARPEITLKGELPLKDELGETWSMPLPAHLAFLGEAAPQSTSKIPPRRSREEMQKASSPRASHDEVAKPEASKSARRSGSPSARRRPRKYERELRQRDLAQRDGHILAADTFDRRHHVRSAGAQRVHRILALNTMALGAPDNGHVFRKHLHELASTRFVAPERPELPPFAPKAAKKRAADGKLSAVEKPPFDLYRSIWRGRLKWASSADLYDTDAVLHARCRFDWQRMLMSYSVAKLIVRKSERPASPVTDDEAPHADFFVDEVMQVGECLLSHYQLCCCVFSFYCAHESLTLDTLTLRGFLAFCSDCNLISKRPGHSTEAALTDIYLSLARAPASAPRMSKEHGGSSAQQQQQQHFPLGRAAFFVALLRIAIHRHVLDGGVPNVADALSQLLTLDVLACVGEEKLQMPDDFRRQYAYTGGVCDELRRRTPWYKKCFEYATSLPGCASVRVISLEQWVELCEQLDILGPDLGEREAVLCFSWSRMCFADEPPASLRDARAWRWSAMGRLKESCLPFEGFLEALCRVAVLKVLPTDGEIALRGDRDAAEYLNSIGRIKYDELVADRSMTWGSPSPLQQPLERSLFHLVNLMASAARDRGINNLALPDQP